YQNLYSRLELLFASSALLWLLAFSWVLTYPVSTRYWKSRPTMVVLGWLMLLPAWVGLVYLKQARPDGALIFLAILVIAIADIGAYFTGRRWGKRKLAVRVSPGKSWEGFWGGFTANLVFAFLLSVFLQLAFFKACLLMVVLGFASVASVIGDLAESMFKRDAGVKDSGTILPGHGGVLDRIDGWMAAIPILALAHLLFVRPGAL
ncbi:MAG: phosphatidate cytidylyltransferase, partial [Pseudomonadales bacterium]|nr:phosphatidate cytidylyltransferase [Pseudomonadales bacterium]